MKDKQKQSAVRQYLAEIGSKGGKKRAAKYDKQILSQWAKKGGRPKKNGNKGQKKKS